MRIYIMQRYAVSGDGSSSTELTASSAIGAKEDMQQYQSSMPKKAQFFLRTTDNKEANAGAMLKGSHVIAEPVSSETAKQHLSRKLLSYNLDVTGIYEDFVKKWLLSNNVPAVYEPEFVLDDKYIHPPDFITGMVDEAGRIVIINPHVNIDEAFMNKQQLLRAAGFHMVIVYKYDSVKWGERGKDRYKFADEYVMVNGHAEHDIKAFLDNKLNSYRVLSKEELFESILNLHIEPMVGNPIKLLRQESRPAAKSKNANK